MTNNWRHIWSTARYTHFPSQKMQKVDPPYFYNIKPLHTEELCGSLESVRIIDRKGRVWWLGIRMWLRYGANSHQLGL